MKLLLYDNHENLFAIKTEALSANIAEEINVYDELQFSLPKSKQNVIDIDKTMYIGVPVKQTNDYRLFKIERPSYEDRIIYVTAIESASDDLDVQFFIKDRRFNNATLKDTLDAIFNGSTWTYELHAKNVNRSTNFYRCSRKEALNKVEKTWGIEVQFRYQVSGNKIEKKVCHVYDTIGQETTTRLVQGRNVISFKYVQDQRKLYTAAVGRGAGVENQDEAGNDTGGYSRSIEFDDLEWSKQKGDPVDKPLGQLYVEIPEATQKWGWIDNKGNRQPRMTVLEFQNEKDKNELLRKTYQELLTLCNPQIEVQTTVAKAGSLNLGDVVTAVSFTPQHFTVKSRVIKIVRDLINNSNTEVDIGNLTVKAEVDREEEISNNITQAVETADQHIQESDKKNLSLYGELHQSLQVEGEEREKLQADLMQKLNITNLRIEDVNSRAEELDADFEQIRSEIESPGAGPIKLRRDPYNPENIQEFTAENYDGSYMRMNGNGLEFIGPNGAYSAITKGKIAADMIEGIRVRAMEIDALQMNGSLVSTTPGGSMTVSIGTDPPGNLWPNDGGRAVWVKSMNYESMLSSGQIMISDGYHVTSIGPNVARIGDSTVITANNISSYVKASSLK